MRKPPESCYIPATSWPVQLRNNKKPLAKIPQTENAELIEDLNKNGIDLIHKSSWAEFFTTFISEENSPLEPELYSLIYCETPDYRTKKWNFDEKILFDFIDKYLMPGGNFMVHTTWLMYPKLLKVLADSDLRNKLKVEDYPHVFIHNSYPDTWGTK